MTRFAVAVALVFAGLAALPAIAAACCADFDRHEPLGWSVEGELLVSAYESSECDGASVAEIHVPGEETPTARFDLYRGGRPLAAGEAPRSLNMWEMEDDVSVDDFPVPARLERRFAYDVTSVCERDLLVVGRADPGDALSTEYWDSHVLLTVSVRTEDGFTPILRDLRVSRGLAEAADVHVHPSPDGVHAVLRISEDGPDYIGDDLRWIEIPSGMASAGVSCPGAAAVIPARDNLRQPGIEEENWFISDALQTQEELASARDQGEAAELAGWLQRILNRALWADPGNDVIRAALVSAFEGVGAADVAAEVASDLPDERLPPLLARATPTTVPRSEPTPAALAGDGPKAPPLCIDDAGCPLPEAIPAEPGAVTPHPASCDVVEGKTPTLAVVFPIAIVAAGLVFSVYRRRRKGRPISSK